MKLAADIVQETEHFVIQRVELARVQLVSLGILIGLAEYDNLLPLGAVFRQQRFIFLQLLRDDRIVPAELLQLLGHFVVARYLGFDIIRKLIIGCQILGQQKRQHIGLNHFIVQTNL
ncbi:hypothetical protein D3C71_1557520 [compost metagenome]